MKLNESALKEACLKVAKNAVWDIKPYDASIITNLTESYYKIACDHHLEFLTDSYDDPNVLTRAIEYMASVTVPCGEQTEWFSTYLEALIEVACPNLFSEEKLAFLNDIESGIAEVRSEVGEN
jgi:hypothetical protein